MSKLDDSMETFLTEIEEYSKRLEKENKEKTDECEDTADSSVCDSNWELDNLYQEVEVIKEELEAEKRKSEESFRNH